jgi:hypothetical protein
MVDMLALFQDVTLGPEPGQEVYWILGLMATALATMFWQLLKAKDEYATSCKDREVTCMTALSGSNTTLAALTQEMKTDNADVKRRQEQILAKLDDVQDVLKGPMAPRGARK